MDEIQSGNRKAFFYLRTTSTLLNYLLGNWLLLVMPVCAFINTLDFAFNFLTSLMITDWLIKYIFRKEPEFCIMLGQVTQKGSTYAAFSSKKIWQRETTKKKVKSIISLRWKPSEEILQLAARETFMNSIFGKESDYNEGLLKINAWHNSQEWNLDHLTKDDLQKSDGLNALTVLVRTKHRKATSDYLHLNLYEKVPLICFLLHPMVVKIPVISIQHYVDIHSAFAFNEIRLSNIENADDLISYIYDLQYIQQKTAMALHELLYLIDYNEKNKGEALLIQGELSAINETESIFTNLKATIEKLVVIIGLMYKIRNLETKKTHKAKIDALGKGIPEAVKKLDYYGLISELIKSESIEELNNYRTGLLHKKGISALQPHSFVGQKATEVPLKDIFNFLIDQHSKNSAVIICTYALLTDELVKLRKPSIRYEDLPF